MKNELKDIKRRLRKVEAFVKADLSAIVEFQSNEEKETVTVLAAQHGMTVPAYLRSCMLKVSNDIFAEREAAKAKQEIEQSGENPDEPELPLESSEEEGESANV